MDRRFGFILDLSDPQANDLDPWELRPKKIEFGYVVA